MLLSSEMGGLAWLKGSGVFFHVGEEVDPDSKSAAPDMEKDS
jgi:hypothetical protein